MSRISEIEPPSAPPPKLAILGEARIGIEWASMHLAMPWLRRRTQRGDGGPVMVVPGFATDDGWTRHLRDLLSSIGYEVRGWDLGRNHGRVPELIPQVIGQTEAFAEETGRRVRLIGWSLGGYLVREAARERPDLVRQVVTLGSPIIGGPKYTASAPFYLRKGYDLDAIEAEVAERERDALTVPVDALFSKTDGVVAWRSCIDHTNPLTRHHEVAASHLGLIASPTVFLKVAELLAEQPERRIS
jgi:pimeloyl-ACP methyl ester carboxylesterase